MVTSGFFLNDFLSSNMNADRRTIVFIACSLDGYIAGPGEDLSFLSLAEMEGEDYGYSSFIQSIDTVIIGRKTYDWVMKAVPVFPHEDKQTYVITRQHIPSKGNITFYNDSLKELILRLKNTEGKNIFIDGGSEIIDLLLKDSLIDEFIISIIPVLLGDGIPLFKKGSQPINLNMDSVQTFKSGLVQLRYKMK